MQMRRALLAWLPGLLALLIVAADAAAQPTTCHYREFGDARGFLNVGPRQDGSLNAAEAVQAEAGTYPPYVRDQRDMYANLVYAAPGVDETHLFDFFKDASFGCREDDVLRVDSPTAGVTIVRDASHGVPHIFGTTRAATMFGEGYATAEDRLFLMDVLRHVGRARMAEFLGASPANVEMDREQLAVAPYDEADLTAQASRSRIPTRRRASSRSSCCAPGRTAPRRSSPRVVAARSAFRGCR